MPCMGGGKDEAVLSGAVAVLQVLNGYRNGGMENVVMGAPQGA